MISVVLCTYNRAQSLKRTLESLAGVARPADMPWELVVVDNNSHDETKAVVEEFSQTSGIHTRYVFEGHQGLSFARNAGIAEARGDIVAFTDDDVAVDSQWLGALRNAFDETDCVGVGGRVLPVWSCARPRWLEEDSRYPLMTGVIVRFDLGSERSRLTTPPFGANMSFRRAAFDKYGLFRTDLGRTGTQLTGGEDTEFGRRLLRGNETLVYDPRAIIYHPVDPERVRQRYFRAWYFNYGRSLVRVRGVPDTVPCFFGVPWSLFRSLAGNLWGVTRAFTPAGLFHTKLQVCMTLGQMAEAYKVSREGRQHRP
jgi:glycosyltransferase involved in cell wall biosynthesis